MDNPIIEQEDLNRIYLEIESDGKDKLAWVRETGIAEDTFFDEINMIFDAMVITMEEIIKERPEEDKSEIMAKAIRAAFCSVFQLGWEVQKQLGKPSTVIPPPYPPSQE